MEQEGIWWKAVYHGLPAAEIVLMGYCLYRLVAPFMGMDGLEGGNLQVSEWMTFDWMSPAADRKARKPKKAAARAGAAYALVMLGIYIISLCLEGLPLRRWMGALAVLLTCHTGTPKAQIGGDSSVYYLPHRAAQQKAGHYAGQDRCPYGRHSPDRAFRKAGNGGLGHMGE